MMEQLNTVQPHPLPRQVTRSIGLRAWSQPDVRFYWVIALVLGIVALGMGIAVGMDWNHERRLVSHGTPVDAIVQQAGEQTLAGRKQPPDTLCILRFEWHGSPHVTRPAYLAGRQEYVAPQDVVRIFVNPDDPDDWTARSEPGPIGPRLLGAVIALAAALVALAVAWLYRARVLSVWRNGESVEALVIESRNTALAPMSRAVRCTPAEEADTRVFSVYVPARAGKLERGDRIWILSRGKSARGAQSAAWFTGSQ
jgi:hypothetical protein